MNESENNNVTINKQHDRQDIDRVRTFDANRHRYRFAISLIEEQGNGLKVADIGGGAGEFTEILRSFGYKTLLVDGNPNSVQQEVEKGSEAIQVDLNKGLPGIENESVDGVVCLEVIEHIVPAEQLLSEIQRILKPGGFFVMSTPNFSYILDRLAYLLGKDAKEEGYHFRFYTKNKLRNMLKDAGFEMENTASFGGVLGINFLLRVVTLGKVRIQPVQFPDFCESLLGRTFVYRLKKIRA